jgi:hypothetical protein
MQMGGQAIYSQHQSNLLISDTEHKNIKFKIETTNLVIINGMFSAPVGMDTPPR